MLAEPPAASRPRRPPTRALAPALPGLLAILTGLVLGILVAQQPAIYRLDLATADGWQVTGFHQPERNSGGGFRWTTGEASLRLPPLGQPARLRITAIGARPDGLPPPTLVAQLDGRSVANWRTLNGESTFETTLDAWPPLLTASRLTLRSETFVPGPQDRRTLGVAVRWVELEVGGAGRPVIPPLVVLALWGGLPLLIQRAARHLGLPSWPSLILALGGSLALATQAAADRAGWLLTAPRLGLSMALLAAAAAVAPVIAHRVRPRLRRIIGALRLGLLPAWPEWDPIAELPAARRRRLRLAVTALGPALILLHLISWWVPPEALHWQSHAWGLRYVHNLPFWLGLGLALPALLVALPPVAGRLWWLGEWAGRRLSQPLQGRNTYLLVLMGALVGLPLLWLGRVNPGRLGDSAELEQKIAVEGALWREREPLDFFLHAQAYRLLHPLFGWDVATIYAIISCLAGSLVIGCLVLLAALLTRRRRDRCLVGLLIAGGGFSQLFFGYLESYTLVTAGLALFLVLGLFCLAQRLGIGWPATALGLATTFHPIAIATGPALAVILLQRWHRRGYGWRALGGLLLPMVAGLVLPLLVLVGLFLANGYTAERWAIARNQFGGADQRTFKPLLVVTSHLERYPLLSFDHLRALVNEQLLIAPFGWPLIVLMLAIARPIGLWRDARFAFLLLAAASTTAFTSLWNPDLGPAKDWDLLSIGSLPTMALAAFLLVTLVPRGPDRRASGLTLLAASAYHTGLWVAHNSLLLAAWLPAGP
jgi:hypothetical protein